MALSEKLYTLRKQQGLSQEQLAERLGVSRQAISKWESGASMPESDKLLAISEYFQVTVDYLLKDGQEPEKRNSRPESSTARWLGLIACVGGAVCLIVWGLLSVFCPAASERISTSSAILIDGNGVFLTLCAAAMVAGGWLLLKSSKND